MALTGLERIGNLGYLGLAPESTIGTAVTPDDWTLLNDESLTTDYSLQDQTPIFGQPFETFTTLPGMRTHKGDVTVIAEPNTLTYFLDGTFTRGTGNPTYTFTITSASATVGNTYTNNGATFTVVSTISSSTTLLCYGTGAPSSSGTLTYVSGSPTGNITFSAVSASAAPYNWPFTLAGPTSTTVATKSYTMDVSTGNFTKRYIGCMFSNIKPSWNKNELQLKISASALGSFIGAQLSATPTGSGPYACTFETAYSSVPTTGLVAGDLVRFYHKGGTSYTDTTISAVTNGTQVTVAGNVTSFAAGDYMYLRPATPSFNLLNTFLASNTQWQFGTNLATAFAATPTRVELESTWELMNNFVNAAGSQRFGSADPASLIRSTGNASVTVKKFFDLTDDIQLYKLLTNTALVVTHYSGSTNQYQFQIQFPQLVTDNPLPQLKAKSVNYSNIKMHPDYNSATSGGFSMNVTNALSTLT